MGRCSAQDEFRGSVTAKMHSSKRRSFKTVFVECASDAGESPTVPARMPSWCASQILQTLWMTRLQNLANTLSLKTLQVLLLLLRWSSNKQSCSACFGASCQIRKTLKESSSSKLKGWAVASSGCSLHHFDLSRIDVSLLVLFTTHLHIESKSSDSVQVVDRKMGLKAAHVSQKLIWSLWYFWWKVYNCCKKWGAKMHQTA